MGSIEIDVNVDISGMHACSSFFKWMYFGSEYYS